MILKRKWEYSLLTQMTALSAALAHFPLETRPFHGKAEKWSPQRTDSGPDTCGMKALPLTVGTGQMAWPSRASVSSSLKWGRSCLPRACLTRTHIPGASPCAKCFAFGLRTNVHHHCHLWRKTTSVPVEFMRCHFSFHLLFASVPLSQYIHACVFPSFLLVIHRDSVPPVLPFLLSYYQKI